jgi:hypothetical protein
MSDVVVNVVESATNVTVTEQDVAVDVTETNVQVSTNSVGLQGTPGVGYTGVTSITSITIGAGLKTFTLVGAYAGAFITGMRIRAIHLDTPTYYLEGTANYVGGGTLIITVDKFNGSGSHNLWAFSVAGEVGQTGATGATGATGSSGVVSVTAPITNSGSSGSAIIGINQAGLAISKSQVSDFTSGTVTSASTAQQSGTAVYSVNSGTAVYSTTSGTALTITGDITKSQVSDFTSGTVASAGTAQQSGTAVYSVSSGTAVSISGSITQSQVTNLTTDLAAKAPLASPTFTGNVTLPFTNSGIVHSGTAGLMQVSAAAPGLGYIPYTAPVSGLYAWQDISLVARDNTANAFTVGGHSITNDNVATVPLYIRGAASQTADVLQVQNSAGGNLFRVTPDDARFAGAVMAGNSGSGILATLTSYATTAGTKGLVVRGAASQTANLFEVQDSSGNNLVSINPAGRYFSTSRFSLGDTSFTGFMTLLNTNGSIPTLLLKNATSYTASQDQVVYQQNTGTVLGGRNANAQIYTGLTAPATTSTGGATTAASGDGTTATITTTSAHSLAVADRVTVAGVTPTGYNGTYIVASTPTTTTFTYANATTGSQTVAGTVRVDAQASVVSRSAATVGLLVRGASSQAANIFEIQNSGGSSQVTVTSAGNLIAIGQARVGTGTSLGQLSVVSASAGTLGAVIRGAASQTGDLLQIQNSAGSVLLDVDSSGFLTGNGAISHTPPTNTWIGNGPRGPGNGDQTNLNGDLHVTPFAISSTRVLDAVAVYVGGLGSGSAGAVGRIGIWSCDANGVPTTLVRDCGTVALTGTAGTPVQISGLAQTLTAGFYWIGCVIQGSPTVLPYMVVSGVVMSPFAYSFQGTGATATTVDFLGNNTYRANGVTGAFTATPPTFTYNSNSVSPIKVIWRFTA